MNPITRLKSAPRRERMLIGGTCLVFAVSVCSAAKAGNYEASNFGSYGAIGRETTPGLGFANPLGGGGGGWTQAQTRGHAPAYSDAANRMVGSVWGGIRDWFGGPGTTLGQVDYSAPSYGIGYSSFGGDGYGGGSGQMDPDSRGSGVSW